MSPALKRFAPYYALNIYRQVFSPKCTFQVAEPNNARASSLNPFVNNCLDDSESYPSARPALELHGSPNPAATNTPDDSESDTSARPTLECNGSPNPDTTNTPDDPSYIMKPKGSLNKPNHGGYALQATLGWAPQEYKNIFSFIQQLAQVKLDTTRSYRMQSAKAISKVCEQADKQYPKLWAYKNHWATKDFLQLSLKVMSHCTKLSCKTVLSRPLEGTLMHTLRSKGNSVLTSNDKMDTTGSGHVEIRQVVTRYHAASDKGYMCLYGLHAASMEEYASHCNGIKAKIFYLASDPRPFTLAIINLPKAPWLMAAERY
ncbi:hypothetical protein K439DRAFT_1624779 [Ramaria rubella]|nr:hypothetical protein K439DRAFT_1624779 [Ramaria rubella]